MKQPRCDGTGKAMFDSEREALQTAAAIRFNVTKKNRQKHRQGAPKQCRAYLCDYCKRWHLTSLPAYTEAANIKSKPLKYVNQFKRYMQ